MLVIIKVCTPCTCFIDYRHNFQYFSNQTFINTKKHQFFVPVKLNYVGLITESQRRI